MQTIRVLCVALTAGVISSLTIAQQKPPSINFYIHDVDAARMVVKRDRAAYEAELGRVCTIFCVNGSDFSERRCALQTEW